MKISYKNISYYYHLQLTERKVNCEVKNPQLTQKFINFSLWWLFWNEKHIAQKYCIGFLGGEETC